MDKPSGAIRLNKYLASATRLSRRGADEAIAQGRVKIDGEIATPGKTVTGHETILLDNKPVSAPSTTQTILFNKPVGYIVSRDGQGGRTIYDLLPVELRRLKPVGRLDKNSSGLLLLTNDGQLAEQLTHPRYGKVKIYEIKLEKDLAPLHRQMIAEMGVQLEDGYSRLGLERMHDGDEKQWRVTMSEGRNRQIRRTFAALGYDVTRLHRTTFGNYTLGDLAVGQFTPTS